MILPYSFHSHSNVDARPQMMLWNTYTLPPTRFLMNCWYNLNIHLL